MCVLVYVRTHTQTAWVLDVSPGVGRTSGEPDADILLEAIEELRQRTTAGAATILVKVKAHRGEPANEEANIQAYQDHTRCTHLHFNA